MRHSRWVLGLLVLVGTAIVAGAGEAPPKLVPGGSFTITFPDMPQTFYAMAQKKDVKAQMTVFLPFNYDPKRKHPLLVFLNGGDGGPGGNPGVARSLCEGKDFVCASVPLFKLKEPNAPGGSYIMHDEDANCMWPHFRTMMDKLEKVVPNIDSAHRVLAGFSNGAHATQGLIDQSDGEVARRFSAFFFVEGGGRLQHYELLKGKPFLMVSSNAKSKPRAQQICDTAKAAGVKATLLVQDVGKHDFPVTAYPAVREWLRASVSGEAAKESAATQTAQPSDSPPPAARATSAPTGNKYITVMVGQQKRTCVVHLPPAYDGKRPLPVVIVFHGAGGTGAGMAGTTGLSPLADKEGFIAAYPDGIVGGNRGWGALFGKPIPGGSGAQVDDVDDVGFARNLIDELHKSYHSDANRVFVCGHSSGAYMAYRVAIDLADRVAAAGVVNGSMGIRLLDGKPSIEDIPQPVAPISIIHICGGKDNLVKFAGGQTTKVIAKSVPDCIQHFVKADGCAAQPKETRDAEHAVTRTLFSGGKAGTEVELVIVENANHSWPTAKDGLSATQELLEFFSKHPKTASAGTSTTKP